ncbi:kynurenine--oxoglutarate transaminase 3-like [Diaphorina citri]|uniref:kynurenine--oxoglutarate transaminase n=1 Tax=Diaphorina citri TaxID=121845 RepID=A0A1S3DS52_DIACI|nr:kynurenine--oxoglutarate transaminase 3-like [Diaphorina citri]
MTGWKLGWAYGPANLMRNLQIVHQNCIYTSSTPTQEAVARSFETEINNMTTAPDKCYFYTISEELRPKREILADALDKAGMVSWTL